MDHLARCLALSVLAGSVAHAQDRIRPIALSPDHNHTRFTVTPGDHVFTTRAYVASFDTNDDDNDDGVADLWGVPEWVAYQLNPGPAIPGGVAQRPQSWLAVPGLPMNVPSPDDASYRNSGFSRGHMCRREDASRLGQDANFNSFVVANACPQLQAFNGGLWNALEERISEDWSDQFGRLWVICGPVFLDDEGQELPGQFIGDGVEVKVAVPQFFYKIVVRDSDDPARPEVLAYLFPHDAMLDDADKRQDMSAFVVGVDRLERLTGLNFFANLATEVQAAIEAEPAAEWPFRRN